MVLKVYVAICTMLAAAAAALFVTGSFTAIVSVVFGFIAFGVVFMGMMFVLPFTATHPALARVEVEPRRETAPIPSYARTEVNNLRPGLVNHLR